MTSPPPGPDPPSEAEIARVTVRYLSGPGRRLRDLAVTAEGFPDSLDRAAIQDRCARLADSMSQRYPSERLLRTIGGLRDAETRRLVSNELAAMADALGRCRSGEATAARRSAEIAARTAADFDRRTRELDELAKR